MSWEKERVKGKQGASGKKRPGFSISAAAGDPAAGNGNIELCGNRRAIIEGSGGVLEYGPEVVRIRLGKLSVRFTGRNLRIRSMSGSSMVLEGVLFGVEYLL